MANDITEVKTRVGIVAKLAAQILADEMHFCKSVSKADKSDYNGKNGYSAGDTIQINRPARFVPTTSFDITSSQEDILEDTVSLQLDTISTVGVNLTTQELAHDMNLKSLAERVIKPAASAIAQDVEQRFVEKATDATFNSVGTAGSETFVPDTILHARALMNKNLCPKDNERYLFLNSDATREAVDARKGLFQSSSEIDKQYKDGIVGRADGFSWMESELTNLHTNGNDVTGVAVDDASVATGASTLHMDGFTANTGTIKKGQVFTVADVYAVHPITKETMSHLQQFTVTADGTADANGDITVAISPTFYSSTSRQNVDSLPANDAAVVFVGAASTAYNQNLAYHKSAFRLVSAPLVMPINAEFAAQETVDGITVAIVRDFDVQTRKMITRLDFLGGLAAVRPEWACRITG